MHGQTSCALSSCPSHPLRAMQYKVVSAHSEKGLNTSATAVLCGFQRDWSPKNCSFTLSPLRNTYFAVQPKDTGLFFIGELCHSLGLAAICGFCFTG